MINLPAAPGLRVAASLVLAAVLAAAGQVRADALGPHWSADQLRAARDVAPVGALRFHLRRVHIGQKGRTVSDADVVLAPSFTLVKTGARSLLYDHALCRWLSWPSGAGGLASLNCHALPYLFGVEMQRRLAPENAAPDAAAQARAIYAAACELHLSAGAADLTRLTQKTGAAYALAGRRVAWTTGAGAALQPDEVHRVVRFLALATPVHPQVRKDVGAAARLPGTIELDGLGPGGNERETLVFSRIARARSAYPLPAGLAPDLDAAVGANDADMAAAVRSAVTVLRDPAARPEPTLEALVERGVAAAAARQPTGVVLSYFGAVQLYPESFTTEAGRTRVQPLLARLAEARQDARAEALWQASRLAGDAALTGDRQAAARALLDGVGAGDDPVDFRDVTLGNLLVAAGYREGWPADLRARLPQTAAPLFWRAVAAAPWPANTYHDLGIALLREDAVDKAWLAFDLGRAVDPHWTAGVMATIADAEQRLERTMPDFF